MYFTQRMRFYRSILAVHRLCDGACDTQVHSDIGPGTILQGAPATLQRSSPGSLAVHIVRCHGSRRPGWAHNTTITQSQNVPGIYQKLDHPCLPGRRALKNPKGLN